MNSEVPLIRLLSLPGVQKLEGQLLLALSPRSPEEPFLEDRIDLVSRQLFGITEADTKLPDLDDDWDEFVYNSHWDRLKERDALFPPEAYGHPGTVHYYSAFGIDVANDHGQPALILRNFHRQIVMSELGLMGTRLGQSTATWEAQLSEDAKSFASVQRSAPWQAYRRQ